jgi:ubiquinone/menaquinone biosynthesis C-methylase UbiE
MQDLFKGTAWYYARYRPGYPKQFFKHLVRTFKLDGTGRLLDLGCGTGQLAIPLAPYFNEVVAMDPDLAMLREGRRVAKKAKAKNIRWVRGSSETLGPRTGAFRLVVMGRSFHWMNQKRALAKLYKIVKPGGGIVIVSEGRGYGAWTRRSTGWRAALDNTVKKYLGPRRRAGSGYYNPSEKRFEDFIRESPFRSFKTYRQKVKFAWDLKGVMGYSYSRSLGAKPLFGKRARAFERDLKEALEAANHSGTFVDHTTLEALISFRM